MHQRFSGIVASLAGLAFGASGCDKPKPMEILAKGSPPETQALYFELPTADSMEAQLNKPFRGESPFLPTGSSPDNKKERALYEELLKAAAFHPLEDWKVIEVLSEPLGHHWGVKYYLLQVGDRGFRLADHIEPGYDGRLGSATAGLVLDKLVEDQILNGRALMYANDDWIALPIKILEDRLALAHRILPKRALFLEAQADIMEWLPVDDFATEPKQPAPVVIPNPDKPSWHATRYWKGAGPLGEIQHQIYSRILISAASATLESWKFTETLAEGFGKRSQVWGTRSFQIELPEGICTITEYVEHGGDYLKSRCFLTLHAKKQDEVHYNRAIPMKLDGGWAELPYQYLERRFEAAQGKLPTRIPFVTTPNTPGKFVQ